MRVLAHVCRHLPNSSAITTAIALAAACFALVGCSHESEAKTPSGAKEHGGAEHFYPLDPGTQWTFTIHLEGAPDGQIATTKVARRDGANVTLTTGDRQTDLFVAGDGIVREPSGAYLLRVPARLHDSWSGLGGSRVEVTAVDAAVTVDAGSFTGCVQTTETIGGDSPEVLKTTFCPEVGPVAIDSTSPEMAGGMPRHILGSLRAYGAPLDLLAAPTPAS